MIISFIFILLISKVMLYILGSFQFRVNLESSCLFILRRFPEFWLGLCWSVLEKIDILITVSFWIMYCLFSNVCKDIFHIFWEGWCGTSHSVMAEGEIWQSNRIQNSKQAITGNFSPTANGVFSVSFF